VTASVTDDGRPASWKTSWSAVTNSVARFDKNPGDLILCHHGQGLTDGVRAFADDLRAAGHVVHLHARRRHGARRAAWLRRDHRAGRAAAEGLPDDIVYAGRPGARGAMLIESCIPPAEFGRLVAGRRRGPDPPGGT